MKTRGTIAVFGIAALLAVGVACSNGEANGTEPRQTVAAPIAPAAQPLPGAPAVEPVTAVQASSEPARPVKGPPLPAPKPAVAVAPPPAVAAPPAPAIEPAPAVRARPDSGNGVAVARSAAPFGGPTPSGYPGAPLLQVGGGQAGIWVMGHGKMSLEPDLTVLDIGVETQALTVAEARDLAARAMASILAAVKAHGLADTDLQTRSFNIWPRYDYSERKQVLVGYTVSNRASIKVRDMDSIGEIIDDVADAGGDATRINGIRFTVEDPTPFMADLREMAVRDALAKAEHFAGLTGVNVGSLMFISEAGAQAPVARDFGGGAIALESARAAAPPTSISGGELELSLTVQAVFDIQ